MTSEENKRALSGIVDSIAKLSMIVEALSSKVGMLPNGGDKTESLPDKLDRERKERKDQQKRDAHTARVITQKINSGSRPTSRANREEASRRFTELRGHAAPAARPSPPQAASGTPIEFYCWKNGEMGKIDILSSSEFKPL
jgi:hypothetical protein